MPRRSRDRRRTPLDLLEAKVDKLTGERTCPKLIHLYIPGQARPSATPGCAGCVELQRQYDMAPPPPPAPRPIDTDDLEEEEEIP